MEKNLIYYIKEYSKINKLEEKPNKQLKFALLRSYSCEILEKIITVDGYYNGFQTSVWLGEYNQYNHEIINLSSGLYKNEFDVVLLAVNIEDMCSEVFDNYYNHYEEIEDILYNSVDNFINTIKVLRKNSNAKIIVNNFVKPYHSHFSTFHNQTVNGINNLIRKINIRLVESLSSMENVFIVDFDAVISDIGRKNAYDLKSDLIAKNPYKFDVYTSLSEEYFGIINSVLGTRKKCIVLDLDNTLWGGIVGEDGIEGIVINDSYKKFQAQIKQWSKTGVLLAICSKNNYDDAMQVIENHPDMVLRKDDFSSIKINWDNKADNIKSIALELNIGLDSLVFFDDSEFECNLIKEQLPEVEVVWLNGEYLNYPDIAKNVKSLDFIKLTDEDISRKDMYEAQNLRRQLENVSVDIESYLRSLKMKATIRPVDEFTINRVVQLTQKTNQFNMTTKRYELSDIKKILEQGYLIYTLSLEDDYGDNGLTGVIIINTDSFVWEIDTFLLSCRIMNRNVEKVLLSYIINLAKQQGIKKIVGEYIPTKKNKPIQNLYSELGFIQENGKWSFDTNDIFETPDYIEVIG